MPHAVAQSPAVSVGVLARNEAGTIGHMLRSLFSQTLFAELEARGQYAEVLCVVNGSTDDTADVAESIFGMYSTAHPHKNGFRTRVHRVREPGKMNAWNRFVHEFSDRKVQYIILMDADIAFVHDTALWNLCDGLANHPEAMASVGKPVKSFAAKDHPTLVERLSLATSRMTQADSAQLTGQLYCIRASAARRIRIPLDLTSCDDGLVKCLLCTDFGTSASRRDRIAQVEGASHRFDAYVSVRDVLKNQKRQMMAQAALHLVLDHFLPTLPPDERRNMADAIYRLEQEDPNWLRRMMAAHLKQTRFFWRLFPNMLTFRFKRLAQFPLPERIRLLPAAIAGFAITLLSCWMAAHALRKGEVRYWPERNQPTSFSAIPTTWT